MYGLVLLCGIALILTAYARFRSIFHPIFVLTVILIIHLFTDFAIRGYAADEIRWIPRGEVYFYQLVILISITLGTAISHLLARKQAISLPKPNSRDREITLLFYDGIALLAIEVLRRLVSVDFHFDEFFLYSFGPRFGRPWSQDGPFGGAGFIESLVGILFPLSGISLGIVFFIKKNIIHKVTSLVGWSASLALLFGNGGRTFFAIALLVPVVFKYGASRTRQEQRAFATILVGTALAAGLLFSVMYQARDSGLTETDLGGAEFVYHQDNSYYMALRAAHISNTTDERWEAAPFFLSAVANFIPRFFWPGKPRLDQTFYGSYKKFYVATSFFGELFAICGLACGAIGGVIIVILFYKFLEFFYARISQPADILVYLLMAYWVFMSARSLLNLSMAIYIPAGAIALQLISRRLGRGASDGYRKSKLR